MDLLVGCAWERGDLVAATADSALTAPKSSGLIDLIDFVVADLAVVLVVAVLMTIVVFDFSHS